MFTKIKDKATIGIANSLLSGYKAEDLNAGKRIISIIAGAYILQKGFRILRKRPLIAFEEIALGSILLYNAASGLNKRITRTPVEPADVRRNQIQGNDPSSDVPAFV